MTYSLHGSLYLYRSRNFNASDPYTCVISEKRLPVHHLFIHLATCTDVEDIYKFIRGMGIIRSSVVDLRIYLRKDIVFVDTTKDCFFCGVLCKYLIANVGNAINEWERAGRECEIVYKTVNEDGAHNECEFANKGEQMRLSLSAIERDDEQHPRESIFCDIVVRREYLERWIRGTEKILDESWKIDLKTDKWWEDWNSENLSVEMENRDGCAKLEVLFEDLLLHLFNHYGKESTISQIIDDYTIVIRDPERVKRSIGEVKKGRCAWTVANIANWYRYKEEETKVQFREALHTRRFQTLPMEIKKMLRAKTVEIGNWPYNHANYQDDDAYAVVLYIQVHGEWDEDEPSYDFLDGLV
jgi:hypothetical protein